MTKRKLVCGFFVWGLLFVFAFLPTAFAEDKPIAVSIDKVMLKLDIDPVIVDGTTLVQFRPIFEKLGLAVTWDATTRTVTGKKNNLDISLAIDRHTATVNGKTFELEVAPQIIADSTLVPLRFVGEASGADVVWNGQERKVNIFFDPVLNLFDAAFYNDSARLARLIDSGVSPNTRNAEGLLPFVEAIWGKAYDAFHTLIAKGADVNKAVEQKDSPFDGMTALHFASSKFESSMMKELIAAGADVNKKAADGSTPLMHAAGDPNMGSKGHPDVVKLLLDAGADPNVVDSNGWTAILHAAIYGQEDVVRLLLDRGANSDLPATYRSSTVGEAKTKLQAMLKRSNTQTNDTVDFRNVKWGMSLDEVKKAETSELEGGLSDFLSYQNVDAYGLKMALYYRFTGGALESGMYMFEPKDKDNAQHLNEYKSIVQSLTGVYGAPDKALEDWKSDTYKQTPEKYGYAIGQGQLTYLTTWTHNRTAITAMISGHDDTVTISVSFRNKDAATKPKDTAAETANDLNDQYGSFPIEGKTFHFKYTVLKSDKNPNDLDIGITIGDPSEIIDLLKLQMADETNMPALLFTIANAAHSKAGGNPTVVLIAQVNTPTYPSGFKDAKITKNDDGSYTVIRTYYSGLFDYDKKKMYLKDELAKGSVEVMNMPG